MSPTEPMSEMEIAALERSDDEWARTAGGFEPMTVRRLLATIRAREVDVVDASGDRSDVLRENGHLRDFLFRKGLLLEYQDHRDGIADPKLHGEAKRGTGS